MSNSKYTVKGCSCPSFGRPKDLNTAGLPTLQDVILCCLEERRLLGKALKSQQEVKFSVIAENVAKKVIGLYECISIPHVSFNRVMQLLRSMHKEYKKMKKYQSLTNEKPSLKNYIDDYKDRCKKLFDIASCKCKRFESCDCSTEKQVPQKVRVFLTDQRLSKKFYLTAQKMKNIYPSTALESSNLNSQQSSNSNSQQSSNSNSQQLSTKSTDSETPQSSQELYTPTVKKEPIATQARMELKNTAAVAQRFGVSPAATAAITSSVLYDVGLITEANTALVTDRSKIRREITKLNYNLKQNFDETLLALKSLHFDERKD